MDTKRKYKVYTDFIKSKKTQIALDLILLFAIVVSVVCGFGLLLYNLYSIVNGGFSVYLALVNVAIIGVYIQLMRLLSVRLSYTEE